MWRRDQPIVQSGRLPFLSLVGEGLAVTKGLQLYVGLTAASLSAHGFVETAAREPPHGSIQFAKDAGQDIQSKCLIRDGASLKPDIFRVGSAVVKVFPDDRSFQNEQMVFNLLKHEEAPILSLLAESIPEKWLVLSPFCELTLADAPFSAALFGRVCATGARVLRLLWNKGLAYADPSPKNVLVSDSSGEVVLWNDFGLVKELGTPATRFEGTRAFASLRWCTLETSPFSYGKIDDAQAVFFTLLYFAWRDDTHHRKLLPWQHNTHGGFPLTSSDRMDLAKLRWASNPSFKVADIVLEFFQDAWMTLTAHGHDEDSRANNFLDLMERFGISASGYADVETVFVAVSLFHKQAQCCTKTELPSTPRHVAELKYSPCPKCFPRP